MGTQQFCLKWNNHQANMVTIFEQLLSTEALVDVTLACDGLSLRAHKMVLSACSPYFQSLFIENPCKHPIVIMKDMRYTELKAIIDFMYRGEVNVSHDQLNALLRTAETLKVKGLAEVCGERTNSGVVQQEVVQQNATSTPVAASTHVPTRSDSPTLLSKRKRGRPRKRSLSDSNRSDDEQVPSKIKQPESPEIEELSADASLDASEVSQNIGGSNSQSLVPVSSVHNSLRTSIQPSQDPQIEEPSECEFEVEPSKLMEQTLSTDVPVISSKSATQIPSSSVHTSSSAIVPSGDSQSLISASVSIASDSLGSSQMQGPDSPQDIKPALLTFEEPPISPVAGTSQENSSMLMYVDPSGVPAIPGTSYQQDSQGAIAQQDSQQEMPQSGLRIVELKSYAKPAPGGTEAACETQQQPPPPPPPSHSHFTQERPLQGGVQYYSSPQQMIKSNSTPYSRTRYTCPYCCYFTGRKDHMTRHLNSHSGFKAFGCSWCNKKFQRKEHLKRHLIVTHGLKPDEPSSVSVTPVALGAPNN